MPICSADQLRQLTTGIFEAIGTPSESAAFVSNALVAANLAGHDSHGVIRILQYIEVVESGALDPKAEPEVIAVDGATLKVDGKWGWGQPAMQLATLQTIELAREYGIAIGVVERSFHIGRVAPYAETIASAGMIGLAMANAGPAVAPYGARTRVMGTNPIAWAVPGDDEDHPFALDIATAQIAEGKVRVARNKGVPVPPGTIVNMDGAPSVDPNDFYGGGALMAFGGHKGSGFSILAQMLGRGLAGMTQERLQGHRGGNGPIVIAIDPTRFGPLELFREAVTGEAERVRGATPAKGFSEVLMPGDAEVREQARREAEGCLVDDTTWDALVGEARRFGLDESLYRDTLDRASV
jgi:LDH2 family malate/lactate/ureidoglycolate dehydrogenase